MQHIALDRQVYVINALELLDGRQEWQTACVKYSYNSSDLTTGELNSCPSGRITGLGEDPMKGIILEKRPVKQTPSLCPIIMLKLLSSFSFCQ